MQKVILTSSISLSVFLSRLQREYYRKMSSGNGVKVLPSGAGYGIVIGIGGVFAILMLGITWLQNRYVRPLRYRHLFEMLTNTDSFQYEAGRRVQYSFSIR